MQNNNINFTGINNIYTGQRAYSKLGSYLTSSGEIKQGTKKYKELLLKCDLTNDKNGRDYSDFWDALSRSRESYQTRCISSITKDHLELKVKRWIVSDNNEKITNSNFTLNGIDITPNERRVLPLFTYLAKLTRNLAANPENSKEKTEFLKLVNKSIYEEAMRFIENM